MSTYFDDDYVLNHLEDIGVDDPSDDQLSAVQETMNSYDEAWWEYEDQRRRAGYQAMEEILLISFEDYHEGIEDLLQRPVQSAEFGPNLKNLRQEVAIALEQLEGIGMLYRTEDDIEKSEIDGLKNIFEAAEQASTDIIGLADLETGNDDSSDSDFRIN